MRGELVVVKDFRGRALVRRVWTATAKAVYITDDEQFERLLANQEALLPIGFPIEDVFQYDPSIGESFENSTDWKKLKPYRLKNLDNPQL